MSTALRSVERLDVLLSTPAAPSGRAPCIHARLRRFAAKPGEKRGLADQGFFLRTDPGLTIEAVDGRLFEAPSRQGYADPGGFGWIFAAPRSSWPDFSPLPPSQMPAPAAMFFSLKMIAGLLGRV
jgi:hypothetical protein